MLQGYRKIMYINNDLFHIILEFKQMLKKKNE